MRSTKFPLLFILGSLFLSVWSAPPPPAAGPSALMACLGRGCDLDSGPVCGIDAAGVPRTFTNRCMADLAYCREGIYYAEVKPGEC